MRRCLLLLIVLCVHFAARGQTNYEYYYWFDNNQSILQSGSSAMGAWLIQADVSHLNESMHAIHVQVRDKNGNYSSPLTRYFVKMAKAGTMLGHYWFDNDIDHIFSSPNIQGIMDIDVSNLTDGLHTLHFVVDAGLGTVSQTETNHFIKVPQTNGVDHMDCLCIIDDELYKQERVAANGGVVIWDLDVSQLSQGFHRMSVQVVTPSGVATNTYEAIFLREPTYEEFANMKCVYAIDGAEFNSEAGTLSNGTFHFDLDVSRLENGLHRIAYMLSDGKGITTKTMSQFFMKTPLGGNGITEYWYWLNEQDESHVKKVTLPERQDPFSLITLLPVESLPIRSKLFQFRMEQDKPVIYAKNDIHLRFFDASGRFTDATKQYVDESVKQEVKDVELLESGIRATTAKPKENTIKWYKVTAERGDSLQFKLDRAATIQLFAPSGKEVYSVSGAESVKWGGCHAEEDGVFYVALHDITAQQGTTISIDYEHIDKYAVLRQNAHIVGNGGCSAITFEGNGFKDLYAVDLYNSHGDTIKHVYIGHESNAKTTISFDFTGKEFGNYDALFHFAGGKLVKVNSIIVEEAKDIELALNVSFPSSFPHGLSTTYTVKITNKGNMTAYSVPIYTWIMNKWKKDGIYHIKYDGLDLPGVFDGVDMDSMSVTDRAEVKALAEKMGDGHYFMLFRTVDEDSPNDSVWVRSNYFFTNIAPYETKTLRLTISADEGVWAYFTVPEEWHSYEIADNRNETRALRARFKAPSLKDQYCCIRKRVECIANLIADGTSIANEILQYSPDLTTQMAAAAADCVASAASKIISTAGTVMCNENSVEKNFWDKVHTALDVTSNTGMITSCISKLPLPWKKIQAILDAIGKGAGGASMAFGLGVDMADCAIAFTEKIPKCPPNPNPGGGGSGGGKSWDPNNIYGYLSESGSKFMTDSVKTMNYTIEFENDTTFATASAYKVIVRDTLDSRYFDLASYTPTSVRIGDKRTNLDGNQNFVTTIDMRPEIDAITQVEGNYDDKKGLMTWTFTSLDPMTMEPATDIMQGFLPVNYNDNGNGDVSYVISKKTGLSHGTEISNRASIVFDINEPILTPTWTNIVDRIEPVSSVKDVTIMNDSTAVVTIDAFDNLSGCWRYDVYVQYGEGSAWWKAAENVSIDTTACVKIYDGINHGFYVVATDSAGNVEKKNPVREAILYNGKTTLIETPSQTTIKDYYDLQGRKVGGVLKKNEIYIMTDGDKKKSQKVVKK